MQIRLFQGANATMLLSSGVILNEAAARPMRSKEPLGKQIRVNNKEYQVIGVGLASFSVERRTKEVVIRKVLGASVGSVFSLITRDFVSMVFVSLILAASPSWYIMNEWLDTFAYRVHMGRGYFCL